MNELPKTDLELYQYSIDELARHLKAICAFDGLTVIVALSRKGPRLLEKILADATFSHKPMIITEHALPFLFMNLAEMKGFNVQIIMVDDAVYFGSTMEGIYKEIMAYESYYHLTYVPKAFAAIKTEESIIIPGLEVKAEKVRSGYGHFFVKQVMSELRSSCKPLEIDFPCITYSMEREVDTIKLKDALNTVYPDSVYHVKHLESESFNVVLKSDSGSFFNKLRIYPDGNNVHVEPMTPRVVTNDVDQMFHEFDNAEGDIFDYWKDLFTLYGLVRDDFPTELRRSLAKTFVTVINYIYSLNTLIKESYNLNTVLKDAGGYVDKISLDKKDLRYLLCENNLVEELYDILSSHLFKNVPLVKSYGINLIKFSDQQIFESYDFPSKEEKEVLKSHDSHMIYNSRNVTQALSAIFFNQNLLIERWSRKNTKLGRSRLNFGYTFQSLKKLISEYRNEFSFDEVDMLKVHQWVDKRIEQGCIVPQYVCDITNKVWTRVFRPGENEDVVLSHLARWVCSVYSVLKEDVQLTRIRKQFFEELLYFLVHQSEALKEEMGLLFTEDQEEHRLFFKDDSGLYMHLLSYMEQMYILNLEKSGFYTISSYLTDEDLILHNTLSKEVNANQKERIIKVVEEFKLHDVPMVAPKLLFNYYYRKEFNYVKIHDIIAKLSETLNNSFIEIREAIKAGKKEFISAELKDKIYITYGPTRFYTVSLDFSRDYNGNGEMSSEEINFIKTQKKFFQLNLVIAIMMAIYSDKNNEQVKSFAEISSDHYEYLEATEIQGEIQKIAKQGTLHEPFTNTHFTYTLQSLINNSVLND